MHFLLLLFEEFGIKVAASVLVMAGSHFSTDFARNTLVSSGDGLLNGKVQNRG